MNQDVGNVLYKYKNNYIIVIKKIKDNDIKKYFITTIK
jgi:hypothetical protein